MKAVTVSFLAIIMCACASQPAAPEKAISSTDSSQTEQVAEETQTANRIAKAKSKYVCRKERGTGTHFTKTVCRTRKQIEEDQEDARRTLDDNRVFSEQSSSTPQ